MQQSNRKISANYTKKKTVDASSSPRQELDEEERFQIHWFVGAIFCKLLLAKQ